ncbi:MAG: DNA mismatch repair protein MutS [Dongiaceae bacterium]
MQPNLAFIEPQNAKAASPLMAQYLELKAGHPQALLFFRLGDFYELFFEDAVKAAAALDITLTKRGQHQGQDIPMCGVPWHQADGYIAKLIKAGFHVAIAEQAEGPAPAKGIIARHIVRIITPGTVTEEGLLEARASHYLAALVEGALAWLEVSTGKFMVKSAEDAALAALLARLSPQEILLPENLATNPVLDDYQKILVRRPAVRFSAAVCEKLLLKAYGIQALDSLGNFTQAEISAAGALLDYVELTQMGKRPRLEKLTREMAASHMMIDGATQRNLELTQSFAGGKAGSLLGLVDRTLTAAGGRLLAERLLAPLTDAKAINARLDSVEFFIQQPSLRGALRGALKLCPDLARSLSRLSLQRGGPRDLAAVKDAVVCARDLRLALTMNLPPELAAIAPALGGFGDLLDKLDRALSADLPLFTRDGGFIKRGYDASLDEIISARDDGKRLIANLQSRYAIEAKAPALKIKHNNILGYFIEVPPKSANGMGEPFIHRQTLSTGVRFTTVELGELESKILKAADHALALELELFAALSTLVLNEAEALGRLADSLAVLDVSAALAELAVERNYVRATIDDSLAFAITGGRHAVVEAMVNSFTPNDCDLNANQKLWLITGPNMAGKSTFLRQNALIAILAQMGSFVPAASSHIGVIDQVFSRVGAADDLARGRSTFMVEMVETAAILNQAGPRALVILDEIGRGTATFDGLSIAWAALEHLHDINQCRALFATHYHELTALEEKLNSLKSYSMQVKEWQGEVIFLHTVAAGAADRSYGLHVAKLAGVPEAVVARAAEVLSALEKDQHHQALDGLAKTLPKMKPAAKPEIPPALAALSALNPDDFSPKEALEELYKLKKLI